MRMKPTCNFSPTFMRTLSIDRIEYDVTIQISDLQHGVCERVRACVRACAEEIEPRMLHAYH